MDEATLLDKLQKIEAMFAGATTPGERATATAAAERIRARLTDVRGREPDFPMHYSILDPWARMLFVALCRRYGLWPHRHYRQHLSTVVVCAPRSFQDDTLWPEFESLSEALETHLRAVTERVIHEAIHADATDAVGIAEPRQLPTG